MAQLLVPLLVLLAWSLHASAGKGGNLRGEGMRYFTFPHIRGSEGHSLHVLAFVDRASDHYQPVAHALHEAASAVDADMAFIEVTSDNSEPFKFFNLHAYLNKLPVITLVNWTHGMGQKPYLKYLFDGIPATNVTPARLQAFVDDYFGGRLRPWERTVAHVEENFTAHEAAAGAMEIAGDQFDELALNNDDDVLVMFFAPWCGFSKMVQPMIDDLERYFRHVKTLRILKIDATANDIEHPIIGELKGYPFLALFPAGRKNDAKVIKARVSPEKKEAWTTDVVSMLREYSTHPIMDPPNTTDAPANTDSGFDLSDLDDRVMEF